MKKNILVFALFTVISLIIFWPIFTGKVALNGNLLVSFYPPYGENLPFKQSGWDQLRIYFPFYRETFEQFNNFNIPLWNPYAFAGHPHLADFQTAVFYPINIFGFLLPQIEFWHFLMISALILGTFFTYIYLRSLNLSKTACIFGALTFGFSPYVLTWGQEVIMSPHSIIWLPLILFAIEKFISSNKKIYLSLIAISTSATFFAGYMQNSIYLFIFVIAYLILRIGVRKLLQKPIGFKMIGAFAIGTFISAVQLVPSAEIFFNSSRSQIALKEALVQFLIPIEGIITYIAPDFFGSPATLNFFRSGATRDYTAQYYESIMFVGISALIFSISAFFINRNILSKLNISRPFLFFFGLTSIFSLSTTLLLPTSELLLNIPIPFLSTSIPNRILFIPAFCISILAAIGFQSWLVGKNKIIIRIIIAVALIYFALIAFLVFNRNVGTDLFRFSPYNDPKNTITAFRNLAIPLAVFILSSSLIIIGIYKKNLRKLAAILIITIAFIHIFRFSQKYFSFSDRKYIFPDHPILSYVKDNQNYARSWGLGDAFFENNFATQYEIFWPEGYDSLNIRRYAEFTYAMQGNKLSEFILRADAGIGRGKSELLLDSSSRRRLTDLLGVKHVISKSEDEELLESRNFQKVFEDKDYQVFKNLQVLPRVFLASSYELINDDETIIGRLSDANFDVEDKIILEEQPLITPKAGEGTALIKSYSPNAVTVQTKSSVSKILFLSDNYYPGWKVAVNGQDQDILRANYTFRAVSLPPGDHEVKFYLENNSFVIGAWLSLIGIVTFIIFYLRKTKLLEK